MASRNFMRTVSLVPGGYLPAKYELTGEDYAKLIVKAQNEGTEGICDVIKWCLCYGYVMGHRATVNGAYKEKRPTPKGKEIT